MLPRLRWVPAPGLAVPALVSIALSGAACTSPTSEEVGVAVSQPLFGGAYPELGFDEQPDYIDEKVVALTFDDGPDWTNTALVLNILRDENVKATFFINTINWSDVNTDEPMQALVRRMVDEGHDLGSHTVHHPHLRDMETDAIEAEITGVENTVRTVIGNNRKVTLFRAPFGEPYQDRMNLDHVASIVANHAVHIGWAIDSQDWNCMGSADCTYNNVVNALEDGRYGEILMHSVQAATVGALPRIIDYLRDHNYRMATTEELVCAKFGASSANVIAHRTGGCGVNPPDPDAGVPEDSGTTNPDEDGGTTNPDEDGGTTNPGNDAGTDNPGGDDDGGVTAGCGCRTGGGGGAATLLLGLAAAASLRSRRRRR